MDFMGGLVSGQWHVQPDQKGNGKKGVIPATGKICSVENFFLRNICPPYASPAPEGGGGVCDSAGITCAGSYPEYR